MLEKFRRLLEVERELGKLFSGGGKRYAKLLAEEKALRDTLEWFIERKLEEK